MSGAVWASRYRACWRKQLASASRGAARSGDSATDLCRRSSSSAHCANDTLPPAARRSSSNKQTSALRGAAACGAKAMALRSTSFASSRKHHVQRAVAICIICSAVRSGSAVPRISTAFTLATASQARRGRLSFRQIRAVLSNRSGRGGVMVSNAAQATLTAVLAIARQLRQATRAAPSPTIWPTPKCTSPRIRNALALRLSGT